MPIPYEKRKDYIRNYTLKRLYGITSEDYQRMWNEQDGKCAVCQKNEQDNGQRLSVDHNHITKQVRKLLCLKCNTVLGNVESNPDLLRLLAVYLEQFALKVAPCGKLTAAA
jgi:hypothetical protein